MRKLLFFFLFFGSPLLYAQDDQVIEESNGEDDMEVILDEDLESESYDETYVEHEFIAPADAATTTQYKEEKIYHRGFDENKWRDIVGDNDFKEDAPEVEPPQFRTPAFEGGSEILKAIGYAVIVAIVILLVYFVFKNVRIAPRAKAGIAPFTTSDPEDIHEIDIQGLLKNALAEGNLKMAVRLYYLLLLKNLDDAGLIRWEKDKTNREYLSELFNSDAYYEDVRKLTLGYEEVWYGDHQLPEDSLRSLISKFENLQSRINPIKPS